MLKLLFNALLQQGSYTPTNAELLEYWVSKRDPDRLLACQHSVIDYELEGAKVKTNVLFEAATTAAQVSPSRKKSAELLELVLQFPNILKDKKCAQFERLQESRFQSEAATVKQSGGSGGILGGLGNLFAGVGRG